MQRKRGNGLYERRHELPDAFHAIGKHRLTGWVDALLAQGELVTAMAEVVVGELLQPFQFGVNGGGAREVGVEGGGLGDHRGAP